MHDGGAVAFPGLGNCHGVVYHTNVGLFAYHAGGNPLDSTGKAEAFGMFVRNHVQGSTTYVEVVCNHGVVSVTIEDFTGQPSVSGPNTDPLGHKFVLQGKDPATFAPGKSAWSKCTTKGDVILGVTRKATPPTAVVPATL